MPHIHTSPQPQIELGFGDYTCNLGVHLCGLYETEKERDDILLSFLHQGGCEGDIQLCCPANENFDDMVKNYSRRYPECADHLFDKNAFSIKTAKELYYPDGKFSPKAMDEGLNSFFQETQKNGPKNIRAAADMSWAKKTIPGIQNLMAYESRLNYFIPGKPWISICLYDITRFSGRTIMQVLQTHPYTIMGGFITENPFYRDPDTWLSEHAPEFFQR